MRRGAAAVDDDYLEVPSVQGQPRSQIDQRFDFEGDEDGHRVPAAVDTDNTLDGGHEDVELYDTAQPENFTKAEPRKTKKPLDLAAEKYWMYY